MKKILTPEFLVQTFITGILIFFIQSYFKYMLEPLTSAEKLKKENFLNSKRDVYFQAIELLNRNLANSEMSNRGTIPDTSNRNRGGKYPTEIEINSCFSKLCIYSDDEKIPLTFLKVFDTDDIKLKPILEMSSFINLLRKDLGYGVAIIDTAQDRYKFIQVHRKN